jgi:hypothetical protein
MRVALRPEIEIHASPEAVYAFFEDIEENYTKRHPDHIVFHWVAGENLKRLGESGESSGTR